MQRYCEPKTYSHGLSTILVEGKFYKNTIYKIIESTLSAGWLPGGADTTKAGKNIMGLINLKVFIEQGRKEKSACDGFSKVDIARCHLELTVGLGLLGTTWTTVQDDVAALLDGNCGMLIALEVHQQRIQAGLDPLTVYWQNAKGMFLLSRRILTKTVPNLRKALVT
jgi:hypothetical protein